MTNEFMAMNRSRMHRFAMSILLLAEAIRTDEVLGDNEKPARLEELIRQGSALAAAYVSKYPSPEDDV